MPRNVPILFNRSVEVPAGEEKREPLTLSNTFREIELFELGIIDERYEGDWKAAPVTAKVEVGTHAEKSFQLRHHLPSGTPPGLHPFALVAHLQYRNLWLRLPGLMRVPAQGGWTCEVQPTRPAQQAKEGDHLELRPWQRDVEVQLVLTNRSSDWLYLDIQLENTNSVWDYQLASRRACLPPWSAAHLAQPAKASLATALNQGLSAGPAAPAVPTAEAPEIKIPLQIRPKKRKWFGAPVGGNGETNLTLRVAPLNAESGLPEKAELRPLRVVYVPVRHPWDLLQPVIQKGGAFFRFVFSRRGLFTAVGLGALVYTMMRGGPLAVYYDVRDFCMRPTISDLSTPSDRKVYTLDETISISYEVTNTDRLEISYDGTKVKSSGRSPFEISARTLGVGKHQIKFDASRLRWYGRKEADRSQAPYARKDKAIEITVTGQEVPAPSLRGKTLAEAREIVNSSGGFRIIVAGGDDDPNAIIKTQEPGAEEIAAEGSDIKVTLALRQAPPVPDWIGQPVARALNWGKENKVKVDPQYVPMPGLPVGTIFDQTPTAGTPPAPGATVTVQSTPAGPPPPPPPNIVTPQQAGIWAPARDRDGAEFARWLSTATNLSVSTSARAPAACSVVLIGPQTPRGIAVRQIPSGAVVIGIGKPGSQMLAQLDGATFQPKRSFDSNGVGLDVNDLERLFRPDESPFPERFRISAYNTILPIQQVDAGLLRVAGGGAVLINPADPRGAVAGWAGNRVFWGLPNARAMSEDVRPVFLKLVTRAIEARAGGGGGATSQ